VTFIVDFAMKNLKNGGVPVRNATRGYRHDPTGISWDTTNELQL
jgi:hypothetical protein